MKKFAVLLLLAASVARAQIVTILGTDRITESRSTINNNFAWLNTHKVHWSSGTGAPAAACVVGKEVYLDTAGQQIYWCTATDVWTSLSSSGTSAVWGAITGTLADQADLKTALDTKLAKASNLSDLTNIVTARTNLGLGDSAVRNVGTAAGTVAAGDDPRFAGGGGSGDVKGPAAHAANLFPQWDATPNSKTLVDGVGYANDATCRAGLATTGVASPACVAEAIAAQCALPDMTGHAGKYLTNDGSVASWGTAPKHLIIGISGLTIPAGVTQHHPISGSTTWSDAWLRSAMSPVSGTFSRLYVHVGQNQGAGGSLVCTLYVAGSPTPVSITVPAGQGTQTYTDTTHTAAISAGQTFSLGCTNNHGGASARIDGISIALQE